MLILGLGLLVFVTVRNKDLLSISQPVCGTWLQQSGLTRMPLLLYLEASRVVYPRKNPEFPHPPPQTGSSSTSHVSKWHFSLQLTSSAFSASVLVPHSEYTPAHFMRPLCCYCKARFMPTSRLSWPWVSLLLFLQPLLNPIMYTAFCSQRDLKT